MSSDNSLSAGPGHATELWSPGLIGQTTDDLSIAGGLFMSPKTLSLQLAFEILKFTVSEGKDTINICSPTLTQIYDRIFEILCMLPNVRIIILEDMRIFVELDPNYQLQEGLVIPAETLRLNRSLERQATTCDIHVVPATCIIEINITELESNQFRVHFSSTDKAHCSYRLRNIVCLLLTRTL